MTITPQDRSSRTFGNEEHLPRVPLPSLEASSQRFLEWCAPLLDKDDLAATEAAVASLLEPDSPAHVLHKALEAYDAEPGVGSWLDRFWPARYLGRRDRIALNANFFFLFNPSEQGQVPRAAGLALAAVAYKQQVDAEAVPPLLQRGQPTSMVQHKYLFSTTRIPGEAQDTVRSPYSDEQPGPSTARHVVVFVRGHAYRLDVIGPEGRPYALADLEEALAATLDAAPPVAGSGVGRFTTQARSEWADNRQRLMAIDPANADALETIETALFCLCLDDVVPADDREACEQLLHGDSRNRWFDKAVSFVVFADGTAGINVEHCLLDGTTILGFVDTVLGLPAEVQAGQAGAVRQGPPEPRPVEFVLDAALQAELQAAGDEFEAAAADTATAALAFPGTGADLAKQLGMSPDAYVQMAYQLAHRRARGRTGPTYESIATRQYRNGRTEAMRVVTPEVVTFVAAMDDPASSHAVKVAALRAAAQTHVARVRSCQAGDAPEQHLWELQLIQQREGGELDAAGSLALYDSPGWVTMRADDLSTSSAPSTHIQYFGFGSTSATCIGVAYVLLPDRLKLYLSAPRVVEDELHAFAGQVRVALAEVAELLSVEDG